MKRDELLLNIRPVITTESNSEMTDHEIFQNQTLRPILKFQNDLLISIAQCSQLFVKSAFKSKDSHQQKEIISTILSKDQRIKADLVTSVVALMTEYELSIYHSESAEYRRRILTMSRERLIDQMVTIA